MAGYGPVRPWVHLPSLPAVRVHLGAASRVPDGAGTAPSTRYHAVRTAMYGLPDYQEASLSTTLVPGGLPEYYPNLTLYLGPVYDPF